MEGGNHVKRNKTESKDARNGEENLDRRGAGSGSPRLKEVDAIDHVFTAQNPTRFEACSEALLAGLHFPHAFHAQDAVVTRDKGTCIEIAHIVAVERTVLFV